MNRRSLLAMVHCARRDLGLDEDTYRTALENLTGKRSASELSDVQLTRVIEAFRRQGWVTKAGRDRRSSKPHVRKVWALWNDLCRKGVVRTPTRAALRSFVTRVTGVGDPEWLTIEQATTVIESLKQWSKRTGGVGYSG